VAYVTGAGDSLAAGTLAALISGLPLEEAVRHGTAASSLTVQSRHAVNENLTPDLLNESLALVPKVRILH
ncbi:PfkB family carbohydrate kinase, partial [Rhizobium ruizarguesonis]